MKYLICALTSLALYISGGALAALSDQQTSAIANELLAQADSAPRAAPKPGTGRPKEAPAKHAPVVIPEPPPFPEDDSDQTMIWAGAVGAGMLVIVVALIVMMVRRDSGRKRATAKPARTAPVRRDPFAGNDTDFGKSTIIEPLTVIQTQWKDIQTNSGGLSTIGLEVIQADEDLQQSMKQGGYNPYYSPMTGIEVEEMLPSLSDAEMLGNMGLHDQAIESLERLMVENEHPAPKVWLLLFDHYVRAGMQEKYTHLARGFKAYFNADVPTWHELGHTANKALEDYPAVINKVVRLWNQPTCAVYLDSLLYDNRNGTRTGFSLAAYSDLVFLGELIQTLKQADPTLGAARQ